MPFDNSAPVPTVLDGYTGNWQRHHLIPESIARDARYKTLFEVLASGGYDNDHFGSNGIALPTTDADALKSGFAKHYGSHPRYDDLVRRVLDKIVLDMPNDTAAETLAKTRGLQAFLKDGLIASAVVDNATTSGFTHRQLNPANDNDACRRNAA